MMKKNLLLLKGLLQHQRKKTIDMLTSISKNLYIDKLADIVSKRNYTYHPEEVFLIKKVKNTVPWSYVSSDITRRTFYKKYCKR